MPEEEEKAVEQKQEGSWTDELWVLGVVLSIIAAFGVSFYFHHFASGGGPSYSTK
jgi:hypothetical protein